MILKFLNKIPAGIMVVPLLFGSLVGTFIPEVLQIGGLTTDLFSSAAINTLLAAQLFGLGTGLQVKDMGKVVKRGGVLLVGKFVVGAGLGILVGRLFGAAGFLGLTPLAIIAAVTNSNGSIYLALMGSYGDEVDQGAFPLLSINDGPFLTLIALGASGLATIPVMTLVATIIPIAVGMLLGNIDEGLRDLFSPMGYAIIPIIGFALGTSINLLDVARAGAPGILLGLITTFVGGGVVVLFDRLISKRPGYAAWAVSSTAGNAVAVPAAIAVADPSLMPAVASATVQVAASVVVTAILVPIITDWWAKKYGSPQIPLEEKIVSAEELVSEEELVPFEENIK